MPTAPRVPGSVSDLTSGKLRTGWPAAARVRVRLARTGDLGAVAELIPLAGAAPLEQSMVDAVGTGLLGGALIAGLDHNPRALREDVLRHISADGDYGRGCLRAALILVAEHRDAGIVGALQAYPPPPVVAQTGPIGVVTLAKIKAVVVDDAHRGLTIGAVLLKRCRQIYFHGGFQLIYGQFHTERDLEPYYTGRGFTVLGEGQHLDLSVMFGHPLRVHGGPGQRLFSRHRQSGGT